MYKTVILGLSDKVATLLYVATGIDQIDNESIEHIKSIAQAQEIAIKELQLTDEQIAEIQNDNTKIVKYISEGE